MKKVLSFVLVLTLVLGSFSVAFAAAPVDVKGATCENAVVALSDLGVVSGYEDGTYKPENSVNRAEAAKLIIAALGLTEYAEGVTATSFTDLAGYAWATGYIGYAETLGILKGVGNGCYNPAGQVTYEQVCTMIVRAIGWTDESLAGTWPANYVVKAKSLGILDNIAKAGSTAANRGDVAIMIYNALECPMVAFDKEAMPYGTGDCMLNRLSNENVVKGVVLHDKTKAEDASGAAIVSGYADGVNLINQYGAKVDVFVNKDAEITGVKATKSTFLTGKFNADGKFVADDVKYDVNEATSAAVVLLNNGRYNATVNFKDLVLDTDYTIAAKVSGKTIKEVYSAAEWDGTTIQWTDSLATKLAKNDKFNGNDFWKNDDKKIDTTTFALVGVDSLDKIPEDAIVTYYVNSKITKIEVSTEVITGKVTKVKSGKLTINGTDYKVVTDSAVNENGLTTGAITAEMLGSEGKWFLNHDGKIVKFDGEEETKDYALVTYTAGISTETGIKNTTYASVELLTADGKVKEYRIDKDMTAFATKLAGMTRGTIISYSLDEEGVLDAVTLVTNKDYTGKEYTKKGFFGGTQVAENVVVFTGTAAEDDWAIGAITDLGTNKAVSDAMVVVKDSKIVAIYTNNNPADSIYAVVNGISAVKNGKDKTVDQLDLIIDGKEVTKLTTKDYSATKGSENLLVKLHTAAEDVDGMDAAPVSAAAVTCAGVKDGSIKVEGAYEANGYMQVADTACVYQLTFDSDNDFDAYVVATLSDINKYDYVWLYETDDDEDGFDVIIFIDEDDYDAANAFLTIY